MKLNNFDLKVLDNMARELIYPKGGVSIASLTGYDIYRTFTPLPPGGRPAIFKSLNRLIKAGKVLKTRKADRWSNNTKWGPWTYEVRKDILDETELRILLNESTFTEEESF